MLKIVVGLIAVILANILLGSSLAKLKKEFSKTKFLNGLFKVASILVAVLLMYLCAILNPDILALSINGSEANIEECMKALFIVGIVFYASQDLAKLQKILKIKSSKGE